LSLLPIRLSSGLEFFSHSSFIFCFLVKNHESLFTSFCLSFFGFLSSCSGLPSLTHEKDLSRVKLPSTDTRLGKFKSLSL
jgi:hypothetical protein